MSKNIVLCLDGTGNSFESPDTDSNVVKLYECLTIDARQVAYYHPGVGTMGDPTARSWLGKEASRIRGLAFGHGLMDVITDSYRYLMSTYEDGDRIYIFGFSRGAFTARVLASILHVYGLLCEGNEGLIPYILRLYRKTSREAHHHKSTFEADLAFQWSFAHAHTIKIHLCGLWDTVSTYGWVYDPIQLPFLGSNPIIERGRHAVSIHERRCFYQDNLWGPPLPHQDVQQVWFAGVHSDVGGSYLERTSALSKFPLEWMFVESQAAGLLLNGDRVEVVLGLKDLKPSVPRVPRFVPADCNACLHKSLHGVWWLPEIIPQLDPHVGGHLYLPLGRFRTIPDRSAIHQSALESPSKPHQLPPHTVVPHVSFRQPAPIPAGEGTVRETISPESQGVAFR